MVPDDWRFVIMTSGVHADKAGAVRERYNRASLMTRALVDRWNEVHRVDVASLAEILAFGSAAADDLCDVVRDGVPPFAGPELVTRLRHFLAEDGRVLAAAEAVARADRDAIGALARASQLDARDLLGNQTPETDLLAQLAEPAGAFAASSFGAGFGGSVWALVPASEVEAVATRWMAAFRASPLAGGRVEWFATRTGPGATVLNLSE